MENVKVKELKKLLDEFDDDGEICFSINGGNVSSNYDIQLDNYEYEDDGYLVKSKDVRIDIWCED